MMFNEYLKKYKDYLTLNRNLIVSIISAMIVSAIFAQAIKDQEGFVNATLTIILSYGIYYLVFTLLYYKDNKEKYLTESGSIDKKKLKKDLIKMVTSVGIAEVLFFTSRWGFHYYFLEIGQEAYLASLTAHVIAATIFVVAVNIGVYLTKLYKKE